MSLRAVTRLAWTSWAAAIALGLCAIILAVLRLPETLPPEREGILPLVVALVMTAAVYATVGALVASRRPENPIGWIFLAIGVGLAATFAAYGYADHSLYGGADLPAARYAAAFTDTLFILSVFIGPCIALYLFPTGRPPSRGWRPATWLVLAAPVVTIAGELEPVELPSYPGLQNPLGLPGVAGEVASLAHDLGGVFLPPALFVVTLTSIVVRFRRAGRDERQQIKWVGYVAAMTALCFATMLVAGAVLPSWAPDVLFLAGLLGSGLISVAAAIAILRHRLYDIDLVVNRTLVYGSLMAILAASYIGAVLLLQLAFSPVTEGSSVAVALSTLAVAALFRPARRRVQELVDRRFFRRRYDAGRTLDSFTARLRDQVDLDALGTELVGVVRETMQPAHVSLWLRGAER